MVVFIHEGGAFYRVLKKNGAHVESEARTPALQDDSNVPSPILPRGLGEAAIFLINVPHRNSERRSLYTSHDPG